MTRRKSAEKTNLVGARIELIEVTPTVSTSAYADGDSIGGLQTVANATRGDALSSELVGLTIIDTGTAKPDMTLMFFKDTPEGTFTDNGALVISDAEMIENFIGFLEINTADWVEQNTGQSVVRVTTNDLPLYAVTDGAIYVAVMSDATPTLGSTSALTFKYFVRHAG